MTTAQWKEIPIPPIPNEMRDGFVAHSVTMATHPSGLLAWPYGWRELSGAQDMPLEPGSELTNINELVEHGIEVLPGALALPSGSKLVFLACGTVVAIKPEEDGPAIVGFTTDEPVVYRFPIHRIDGGEPVAKMFLRRAQLDLDEFCAREPDHGEAARMALGALACIGYPNPGVPTTDANVVNIWERQGPGERYLARVQCVGQRDGPYNVSTLVQYGKPAPNFPLMREIADEGRHSFRYDYFTPKVVRVHVVP